MILDYCTRNGFFFFFFEIVSKPPNKIIFTKRQRHRPPPPKYIGFEVTLTGVRVFLFLVFQKARRLLTWSWLRDWCVDWWHSGRDDEYDEEDDQTPSDVPAGISYGTTVSRSTSLNVIHQQPSSTPTPLKSYHAVNNNNRLANRSLSSDSVSTPPNALPRKYAYKYCAQRRRILPVTLFVSNIFIRFSLRF